MRVEGREETAGSQDLEANSTNQPTPCPRDLRIKGVAHNGSTVDRRRARKRVWKKRDQRITMCGPTTPEGSLG